MSAPLPPSVNRTALVICVTVFACFVVAGLVYLQVRGQSTMALTSFLLQLPIAIITAVGAYWARRADGRGEVVQQSVNGHLAHQTTVSDLALAKLPPDEAERVVERATEITAERATVDPTP